VSFRYINVAELLKTLCFERHYTPWSLSAGVGNELGPPVAGGQWSKGSHAVWGSVSRLLDCIRVQVQMQSYCQTARRNRNSSASRPSCRRRWWWQPGNLHVSQVRIKVVVAEIMESPRVARSLYVYKSQLATHRQIIKQFYSPLSWHNLTQFLSL
jgi:hypothetical protein